MPGEHLFKKGNKLGVVGRPKGVPNRQTRLIRQDILDSGDELGFPRWDEENECWVATGEAGGGRKGYLVWLGLYEPKAYATLMGRVLPLQITGADGGPVRIFDATMPSAVVANMYAESLKAAPPPMLDITPQKETKKLPIKAALPPIARRQPTRG